MNAPARLRIHGDVTSGNCLKVKFVADALGLYYDWVETPPAARRSAAFLAINPVGQVPAIELPDGRALAQSNAIIRYLARGSRLLPDDAFDQARCDEWMFWEQYSHEPYVAVCRTQMVYQGRSREAREAWRVERAELALDHLDRSLAGRDFLVTKGVTVADVALLAYTRVAHEGGFDLGGRPNVRRWIGLCERELGLTG